MFFFTILGVYDLVCVLIFKFYDQQNICIFDYIYMNIFETVTRWGLVPLINKYVACVFKKENEEKK